MGRYSAPPPISANNVEEPGEGAIEVPAWGLAVAAALIGLGLFLRLREAWQSLDRLVVYTLPDDAFYYFQLARNVANGEGASLDGETLTSGFHPLWLVLLTPIFTFTDGVTAIHIALTLGAVLSALTIAIVFDVTRRLTGSVPAGLLSAGFFALHPAMIAFGINGLETSVTLLTLAAVCWLFVRMSASSAIPGRAWFIALGLAGGSLVLARTDTVFAVAAVLAWFVLVRRAWLQAAVTGLVTLAVATPWILWCWIVTGSPVQDSAVAGGLLLRKGYFATHGDALDVRIAEGWDVVWQTLYADLPRQFMIALSDDVWPFWLGLGLFAGAVLVVPSVHRAVTIRATALVMVPFAGLLAMLAYEAGVRWFVRGWYFAPYTLLGAILVGVAAHWLEGVVMATRDVFMNRRLLSGGREPAKIVPAWALTLGVYAAVGILLLRQYGPQNEGLSPRYPWQTSVLEASTYLQGNTDPSARIAAYNAGIPSYLSERTVVNLDGVVNRDAYEAARDCRTRDYLREKGIDIVADTLGQFFLSYCGLTFETDLEEIARVGARDPVIIARPRPAK